MSCRFDYEFDMLCTVGGGEPLACLALLHSLPEALAFRDATVRKFSRNR